MRILLTEKDFEDLVLGKISQPENTSKPDMVVEIALQDIGIDRMYAALEKLQKQMHGNRS